MAEALGFVFGFAVFAIVTAAFSTGIAYWLSTASDPHSLRKRSMIAGGLAAGIPIMVPLTVIALEAWGTELLIVGTVLIVLAIFFAVTVGFPVAYYASQKFDAREANQHISK